MGLDTDRGGSVDSVRFRREQPPPNTHEIEAHLTLIINLCGLVTITFQQNVFHSWEIIKIALKGSVHGDPCVGGGAGVSLQCLLCGHDRI